MQQLVALCWRIDQFLQDCPDATSDFRLEELLRSHRVCADPPYATPGSLRDYWQQPVALRYQDTKIVLVSNGQYTSLGTQDDLTVICARFPVASDHPFLPAQR